MNDKDQLITAQDAIKAAKDLLVLLPPDPSQDQVIAALGLHLSFQGSGKNSQIGCPTPIQVDPRVIGTEAITDTVGSRNLIISFDYKEEYLDKVDYDIHDDGRFYLVVKPKEEAPIPDVSAVKFSYSGAEADLVIVLGVNSLEELGPIYSEEKAFLDNAKILSINTSPRPASFTDLQLHRFIPSYSELVALLAEKTGLTPSKDAASDLIFGIYESTGNLSSGKITAQTFTSLSFLMNAGGLLPTQQTNVSKFAQAPFFEPPLPLPPEEDTKVPSDWKKPKIFRANRKNGR